MHINISISKRIIINIIVFVIGLTLLCNGINSYYKSKHAVQLENLSESICKNGVYVKGNIDSYVGFKLMGSNKFSGVSATLLSLTSVKSWDFYTIPIAQGSYIRIMTADKSTIDKLQNFEDGKGEGIYFEGKIIASPVSFPLKWYSHIEGFKANDVVSPYVIKEIKFDNAKNIIYIGFLFLAFSALLFFDAGGIKSVISKETEDENKAVWKNNNYANSYNKSNELLMEKYQLQLLEKRLAALRNRAILGFLMLVMGIYIIFEFYLVAAFHSWIVILTGISLIISSIKRIWKYFINSNNAAAVFLIRKFNMESISLKIEQCRRNMEELEGLLNAEK